MKLTIITEKLTAIKYLAKIISFKATGVCGPTLGDDTSVFGERVRPGHCIEVF